MIIARKPEMKVLNRLYHSKEAEFLVLSGRRRIGKTFLIREFFKNKNCLFFHVTGIQDGDFNTQLKKFASALSETFYGGTTIATPNDWDAAFAILHKEIVKINQKVIVFIDELPWMATRKSGLLQEIDHYWNHYWSSLKNIVFIACGSSASWLTKKIIYHKGGLHNRVTCQIRLLPFTLHESMEYLESRGIYLNKRHIAAIYMAVGGVPYYLRYVESGLTAAQNIQKIFFDKEAPLKEEFIKLFDSLFENAEAYLELILLLSKKKEGLRREELKLVSKLSSGGGRLSKRLKDLCATGFIEKYIPWGRSRGEYYKLVDEFCLFYLHWLYKKPTKFTSDHWLTQIQKPSYYAWGGYAFEAICIKHTANILSALDIKTSSAISGWNYMPRFKNINGAQIDLIIDHHDSAMTIGEIKFTEKSFMITKEYAKELQQKIDVFRNITRTYKRIFIVMISASDIKQNLYSKKLISGLVTLDDLFKEI